MWQKIKEWFYQTPALKPEEELTSSCMGVLVPFHRLDWTEHCSVMLFYQQEEKRNFITYQASFFHFFLSEYCSFEGTYS